MSHKYTTVITVSPCFFSLDRYIKLAYVFQKESAVLSETGRFMSLKTSLFKDPYLYLSVHTNEV